MDYTDEHYSRLYTRRTVTNKRLGWEGRAVMHEMHYELDRAGVFEFPDGEEDPVDSVAAATGLPAKVVRTGLDRLFKTKTFVLQRGAIIWPNYVDAQNCRRSERIRKQASRERRRDETMKNPDEKGGMSQNVTIGHDRSHVSRSVTPSSAVPSSTLHSVCPDPERAREEVEPPGTPDGADTLPRPGWSRGAATWKSYPPGWHWSPETEAAAAAGSVSPTELAEHVDYWTTHDFAAPVNDLDGELRRSIEGIKARCDTKRAKAQQHAQGAPAPSSGAAGSALWVPNAEHRAYAAAKSLDLAKVLPTYRREFRPDDHSTMHADRDFMRRLTCWQVMGVFVPKGELPKPPIKARPRGVESDRAVAS